MPNRLLAVTYGCPFAEMRMKLENVLEPIPANTSCPGEVGVEGARKNHIKTHGLFFHHGRFRVILTPVSTPTELDDDKVREALSCITRLHRKFSAATVLEAIAQYIGALPEDETQARAWHTSTPTNFTGVVRYMPY